MKTGKPVKTALFAVILIISATGCLSISIDELYRLPEISQEYVKLQAQINMLQNRGAVFAPPSRGPNRQALQMTDINSCGVNEVLAFFTYPGENKLVIYVFTLEEDDYVVAEVIESLGSQIESVRYADMNADGNLEIIIGWQMGTTQKYMSIYSIIDFRAQLIVSGEEYTELVTFNSSGTGGEDVVVLKLTSQDTSGAAARMFSYMQDGEVVVEETRLSSGTDTIARTFTGKLEDNKPALLVESEGRFEDGSLVTDILTVNDNGFSNISLNPTSGVSVDTVRHRMNSTDINYDGIVEIPFLRRLPVQSETEYYAIDWYTYKSSGERRRVLTTYHNIFDEWYLILPDDWRDKFTVRREDTTPGERTIIFSYIESQDGDRYTDFLKIYRLSGINAPENAQRDGREMLLSDAQAVYAFELLAAPNSYGITFNESMLRESFRLMRTEWQQR